MLLGQSDAVKTARIAHFSCRNLLIKTTKLMPNSAVKEGSVVCMSRYLSNSLETSSGKIGGEHTKSPDV